MPANYSLLHSLNSYHRGSYPNNRRWNNFTENCLFFWAFFNFYLYCAFSSVCFCCHQQQLGLINTIRQAHCYNRSFVIAGDCSKITNNQRISKTQLSCKILIFVTFLGFSNDSNDSNTIETIFKYPGPSFFVYSIPRTFRNTQFSTTD